jgi:MFS family permease
LAEDKSLHRSYILLTLSIATAGYLASETAVVLPVLSRLYGFTPGQLGSLISVRFLGGIAAAAMLMILGSRFRYSTYVRAVSAAALAASIPLFFSGEYPALMAVSLVRGLVLTTTITNVNVGIAGLFIWNTDRWSARIHSFFGIGLISAPLVAIAVNALKLPWQIIWLIPAAGWLALLLLRGGRAPAKKKEKLGKTEEKQRRPSSIVFLFGVILTLAGVNVGVEAMIVGWAPTYLELTEVVFGPVGTIQVFLSAMIIAGRRAASRFTRVVGTRRYYHISTAFIFLTAGLLLIFYSHSWAVVLLLVLLGFGMSALYPLLIARLSSFAHLFPGRFFPVLEIAATIGGTLLPYILGRFSEVYPAEAFPVSVLSGVLVLVTLSVSLFLLKRKRF